MISNPLKRVNYNHNDTHDAKDHDRDFTDYHDPMARMEHANLFDWGIVQGLNITGAIGNNQLVVQAGVAFDQQGQLIALSEGEDQADIGSNPFHDNNKAVPVPVILDTTYYKDQEIYVIIQFYEKLSGTGNEADYKHRPWIRLQEKIEGIPPEQGLILASVKTDGFGNIRSISGNDRKILTTSLGKLTLRKAMVAGPQSGAFDISEVTSIELNGATGRIKSGDLTIGPWPRRADQYVFFGNNNGLDQMNQGNYALLQRASTGRTYLNSPKDIRFRINNRDKMILDGHGNIGIGTVNPAEKLEIQGSNSPTGLRLSPGYKTSSGRVHPKLHGEFKHGLSDGLIINANAGGGGWGKMSLQTNRTTRLFINHKGNVGVGTTDPKYGKLQIKQDFAGSKNGITLDNGTTTARSYLASNDKWHMTHDGDDEKGIAIDKDGSVCINPRLHVDGDFRVRDGISVEAIENSTNMGPVESDSTTILSAKAIKDYIDDLFVGSVCAFAMERPPEGWLVCDGSWLDCSDYKKLARKLLGKPHPDALPPKFNVPDLRGRFVRGLDLDGEIDPDGIRDIGHSQGDQLRDHEHEFNGADVITSEEGAHTHRDQYRGLGARLDRVNEGVGDGYLVKDFRFNINSTSFPGWHSHKIKTDGDVRSARRFHDAPRGSIGTETRPVNVALLYCIKY